MDRALASDAMQLMPDASEGIGCLTRGMARGDEAAWRDFLDRYEGRLRGYLSTCLGEDRSSLDDAMQDCLIRVTRHVRGFADDEVFWSWLTTIARSVLADHGRRKSAWRRFLGRYRRQRVIDAHPTNGATERLDRALAQLAGPDRDLLTKKYLGRRQVRNLALELGVTEKVVEHRLARARRKLARLMERLTKEENP